MRKSAFIILTLLLLFSCKKQDMEITIIEQEKSIDDYIKNTYANNPTITKEGINRVIIETPDGIDSLQYGDSLYFYYSGFIFSNGPGQMFTTNYQPSAEANKFLLSDQDFQVKKILYTNNSLIKGLSIGLNGVKKGEHSIILFSAKYGYFNSRVYNIPKLSPLIYEVWIDNIIKNKNQ